MIVSLVAVGCSATEDPAEVSTTERIAAVREARAVLGAPAADLATEVAAVRAAVERLRTEPPAEPGRRLAAVLTVRSDQLARLTSALAAVDDVDAGGGTSDVAAAEAAFERAVGAAREVRVAALEDLGAIESAARLDAELAAVVAGWDGTGSRREQMDAFAELVDAAAAAEDRARDLQEVAPCLTTFARRAEAAAVVEARSAELRALVVGYRGNEFDELRDTYRQDPFGDGRLPAEVDAGESGCWEREAGLPTAVDDFDLALSELEAALNPDELSG